MILITMIIMMIMIQPKLHAGTAGSQDFDNDDNNDDDNFDDNDDNNFDDNNEYNFDNDDKN